MRYYSWLLCCCLGLSIALAQPKPKANTYVLRDGTECPPEGTAGSEKGKAINRLKNRNATPGADDIDRDVSLAAMIAPGWDAERFRDNKAATITGYVVKVFAAGSGESCNCGARDAIDMDTHIELALSRTAPPNQRVIVEVTPRFRKMMRERKPAVDWSSATLRDTTRGIKGKWVKVTGWLMFDAIHADEAENTNPGRDGNWRATAWELHPVTSIEILSALPTPSPEFSPAILGEFHKARALDFARDEKRKAALQKDLAGLREGFSAEELKEAERESKERAKESGDK